MCLEKWLDHTEKGTRHNGKNHSVESISVDLSQPGYGGLHLQAGWFYQSCHGILVDVSLVQSQYDCLRHGEDFLQRRKRMYICKNIKVSKHEGAGPLNGSGVTFVTPLPSLIAYYLIETAHPESHFCIPVTGRADNQVCIPRCPPPAPGSRLGQSRIFRTWPGPGCFSPARRGTPDRPPPAGLGRERPP